MHVFSHFDPQGNRLGELFSMSNPDPSSLGLNSAGQAIVGVSQSLLDLLKTREQRKLEEEYLKRAQTPPGSLLSPTAAQQIAQTGNSVANNLPLWLAAGAALFLLTKK